MADSAASQHGAIPDRATTIGLFVACAIGIALRLRAYCFDRSLWLDELFLWSTLGPPRLSRAWEPLYEGQVAAPGFVALVQLLRSVLGDSEPELRFLPLVAGIAALPLLAALLRASAGRLAAVFGVTLLALSPHAIYYSADFKPYSLDLAIALGLLWSATRRLVAGTGPSWRFAAAGLLAVVVSLPASLVVGGCALAFAHEAARRRDRRALATTIVSSLLWLAAFVVMHRSLLSHHHGNADIHDYWVREGAFPSPGLAGALGYVPIAVCRALSNPAGLGDEWGRVTVTTYVAGLLFLAGIVIGWRRDGRIVRLHLAILALALCCGALRLYPFSGRVLCFLVPSLMIPVCIAVDAAARGGAMRVGARVLTIALLFEPALGAARRAIRPQTREESRPVVAELRARIAPGDVVYLGWWARFAWRYYAPRFGLDAVPTVEAAWIPVERVSEYAADATSKLPRSDRVWYFVTHFYPSDDERRAVLRVLAEAGVVEREAIEAPAAAAHRLDLRGVAAR